VGGAGVVVVIFELVPHPASAKLIPRRKEVPSNPPRTEAKTARITTLQEILRMLADARNPRSGRADNWAPIRAGFQNMPCGFGSYNTDRTLSTMGRRFISFARLCTILPELALLELLKGGIRGKSCTKQYLVAALG
jgi:hypothetical protein